MLMELNAFGLLTNVLRSIKRSMYGTQSAVVDEIKRDMNETQS